MNGGESKNDLCHDDVNQHLLVDDSNFFVPSALISSASGIERLSFVFNTQEFYSDDEENDCSISTSSEQATSEVS